MNRMLSWLGRLIHAGLLILGAATALSLVVFYGTIWYEAGPSPVMAMPAVQVSPVATKAAALISHDLQEIAEKAEGPIIASAGGTIERWAARRVYPYAVEKIPVVTEVGCDHLMSKFGEMPMSKVAAWLVEHATAKGQTPHWSVRAAAEAR